MELGAMETNFIKHAFLVWNTDYVLLGGDHNDLITEKEIVPARYLTHLDNEDLSSWNFFVPSDLYYACLRGTFDSDLDGRWGEPNDDAADTNLVPYIYIGRAPVGDTKEVSNFVWKTIEYEKNTKANDPYIRKALMVGQWIDPTYDPPIIQNS